MYRQRPVVSKNMQRKWDFLQAIFDCQIGPVKIDFVKLAHVLGYKNERCAQDSYHRFRRENFPRGKFLGAERRTASGLRKPLAKNSKQQYYADGRMIPGASSSIYRDDDEGPSDPTNSNDDDDDDDEDDEEQDRVVKVEDGEMELAAKKFWSLGFINLEEEEGFGNNAKIKTEPGIKQERVVEKWVWT